jgi:hypothetical protein
MIGPRRRTLAAAPLAALIAVWITGAPPAAAGTEEDEAACGEADRCPEAAGEATAGVRGGLASAAPGTGLIFFWGVGCPHCEEARPFVRALAIELPDLALEEVEVRQDSAGRARFRDTMRALGAEAVGVPAFVAGDGYVIGFSPGVTERAVRELVARARAGAAAPDVIHAIDLPIIGVLDPSSFSLPAITLLIGLVDGVNPCAMWVLLVLLGILVHVRSRGRLLLFGATFVVASGVVYFVFMTAWMHVFALVGLSRGITIGLGILVLLMGLINLKELVWFERGVSLMIPDRAKPGLYRRMRGIARSASLPAAFAGIALLALLVNLIELGCTLGLPAVYTRMLSLRSELSDAARLGYIALYNVAYVVPLAVIVLVYAGTLHRLVLGKRGAKILKGVSGVLLVLFGILLIAAPDALR